MDTLFRIDEGHIFSEEDTIANIKWKVNNLKNQGNSDKDILGFDYYDGWLEYASMFIEEMNKNNNYERNYNYRL